MPTNHGLADLARHRIAARGRMLLNVKGCVWAREADAGVSRHTLVLTGGQKCPL